MIVVEKTMSYKWKPLADLPANPIELTSRELEALELVWAEQKEILAGSGVLEEHYQRLRREWSIETGIIEGVYTLDRGTTEILIARGIDASLIPHDATNKDPALVACIIQDHDETLEGMFAFVKGERELTAGYIKKLHAALLRHVDTFLVVDQFRNHFEKKLEKGRYKELPNNPSRPDGSMHEYCPPEHVAAEMDRMIALHREHVEAGVPTELEAGWLHHVFTQIHPFEDGNGRVARAVATLLFLKAKMFPLVVRRDDRATYIEALELADQGDLKPLVSLFTQIERRALLGAIELTSETRPSKTVDDAITAARVLLIAKGQIPPKEWNQAKSTAGRLFNFAIQKFNSVTQKLQSEIASVRPGFGFGTEANAGVVPTPLAIAEKVQYVVNLQEYHHWLKLKLHTERHAELIVSFHCLGSQFRGLMAISAFLETGDGAPVAVTEDIFQINYKEDPFQAEQRFQPWLEAAIVRGLSLWRQQL